MKRKTITRIALTSVLVAGGGGGAVVAATSASAGGTNACGENYTLIDSYPVRDYANTRQIATIDLYYNSAEGRNCAMLMNDQAGKHWMDVSISNDGRVKEYDGGVYGQYAGPVYSDFGVKGKCVNVLAQVGNELDGGAFGTGDVHCG